jgi:hypothetical protein
MAILDTDFSVPCTGDACTGDVILFAEAVFGGSFRKPKFLGARRVAARIVADSYGGGKQQHTFSLEILDSDGVQPLAAGARTTRKGRNVYRNGTWRRPWADEAARGRQLADKHARGDAARALRDERRAMGEF